MKPESEPEIIITQEEYQRELIKILDDMNLFVKEYYYENVDRPKIEIAPGVEIFHEWLALLAHVYYLDGKTKDIATKEDIAKLYEAYDEKLDEKLLNLYNWYKRDRGSYKLNGY